MNTGFTVPADVTSLSAAIIQPGNSSGGQGNGGGLSYRNSIPVTPGESLTIVLGSFMDCYIARDGVRLVEVRQNGTGRSGLVGQTAYLGSMNNLEYDEEFNVIGGRPGDAAGFFGDASGPPDGRSTPINGIDGTNGTFGSGLNTIGAVRLIWGDGRAFPNINTKNMSQ